MKWDEVEREFLILSTQLSRVSQSFRALARALQREREGRRVTPTNGDAPVEKDRAEIERPEAARIFD